MIRVVRKTWPSEKRKEIFVSYVAFIALHMTLLIAEYFVASSLAIRAEQKKKNVLVF